MERDRPELPWSDVVGEVYAHYGLTPSDLARRGDQARPRAVAAWLGRRFTPVRLQDLCRALGYGRPASIAGILGRLEDWRARDPGVARDLAAIQDRLLARQDRG